MKLIKVEGTSTACRLSFVAEQLEKYEGRLLGICFSIPPNGHFSYVVL